MSQRSEAYDSQANGVGSYLEVVAALRKRHRDIVQRFLPALRRERYNRRLARYKLAAALGVSKNTLEMWESGNRIPNPAMFSRWRDLLRV